VSETAAREGATSVNSIVAMDKEKVNKENVHFYKSILDTQ
jgi:hypothetical protein